MVVPGHSRRLLFLAAILTFVIWQLPFGDLALYPLSLLATYAHEMGHGLTALLVGGRFDALAIYPDGSGLAQWTGDVGRVGRAAVAAGGLLGPSIAGAALLVLSRNTRHAPKLLFLIGLVMLASVGLFVRNGFGILFLLAVAGSLVAIARSWPRAAPFTVQLIGVQLTLALFRDLDYMFSAGGIVNGRPHPSDSAAISQALFGPYWLWGALVAVTAALCLFMGLRFALRGPSAPAPRV